MLNSEEFKPPGTLSRLEIAQGQAVVSVISFLKWVINY